jgi:uncharacterized membrane protein YbhN (UPF0104 family)
MTALDAWSRHRPHGARWWRRVVLAGFGIAALLAVTHLMVGTRSAFAGLSAADDELIVLAAGFCGLTFGAAAVAQRGAVHMAIPLRGLVVVQVACAFTDRFLPGGLGTLATNGRFLRRLGMTSPQATAAVGLKGAAGALVHVVSLLAVVPWLLRHPPPIALSVPVVPEPGLAQWLALALVVLAAAAWLGVCRDAVARGGRVAARAVRQTGHAARLVLAQRAKVGQLVGGSVAFTCLHALAFSMCVIATGGTAPWPDLVAVYLVGAALAALVPVPGGIGAEEASLFLGLTAVGVSPVPALAGVLWFRLISFWLPTLPGAVAFGFLVRRQRL